MYIQELADKIRGIDPHKYAKALILSLSPHLSTSTIKLRAWTFAKGKSELTGREAELIESLIKQPNDVRARYLSDLTRVYDTHYSRARIRGSDAPRPPIPLLADYLAAE